jgi:hypothetical protein
MLCSSAALLMPYGGLSALCGAGCSCIDGALAEQPYYDMHLSQQEATTWLLMA